MKPPPYGLILALDGYGAASDACMDIANLYRLLEALPKHIGMRPLGLPHIAHIEEAGIRGLSGFTFIMESHISIHTYEERGFVTADIYSCKSFDTEAAARFVIDAFAIAVYETNVIERGLRFHSSYANPARRSLL